MAKRKRKEKKQSQIMRELMLLDCDDTAAAEQMQALGVDPSFANAVNLAILRKAVQGDISALRYVRDTIDEAGGEGETGAVDLSMLTDGELAALAGERE